MFRGINSVTMDAKGRMALPARVRESLALVDESPLVITIDTQERCLLLYPLPLWQEVQRKVEALPNMSPPARILQRMLIGHAVDVEPDGAGRILLPPSLRNYAELDRKLAVVGQGNKFEIWSESHWEARMAAWQSDDSVAQLAAAAELTGLSV